VLKFFAFVLLTSSVCLAGSPPRPQAWPDAQRQKKATITVYWFESKPFIYRNANGQLGGIEYELVEGLKVFLKQTQQIDLVINWVEAESFGDAYRRIHHDAVDGIFAVSAFSVTPARQLQVAFSPVYMPDFSVLVSNRNVPVVETPAEFNRVFSGLTAITIQGTTYEADLLQIKSEGACHFNIHYIPSNENIIQTITATPNSFGFIDLPVYMMRFSADPSIDVKRQNVFSKKRLGYAIIHPLNSSWQPALVNYFNAPDFRDKLRTAIGRHMDIELYEFVENLASESGGTTSLLTKEREIQDRDLREKEMILASEVRWKNFLIILTTCFLLSLITIGFLYRRQNQQKEKIEQQSQHLEYKRMEAEKRNRQLEALNEEKNNLIKILAHDLRSPINHIQGLTQLLNMSSATSDSEQKQITATIIESAQRLGQMITNILDTEALERESVQVTSEPVALQPLVEKVVESFQGRAHDKGITLLLLPVPYCTVNAHPLYLMQVLENLISNALKFTPSGKKVSVQVTLDAQAHLCVTDEGPGIPREEQWQLFKKFQRLSTRPTAGEPSTGLGLFIVKRYTELMGGQVRVDSAPGVGTSFRVVLSLAT